jgi:hypothetical protein
MAAFNAATQQARLRAQRVFMARDRSRWVAGSRPAMVMGWELDL